MLNVVLVEPEIPPNTGNVARTCLAAGAALHLVEPLGFDISDRSLKRAGMDYWHLVNITRWPNFLTIKKTYANARFWFFTTKTTRLYFDVHYQDGDFLVFGRETKGLPKSLLDANADHCVTLPMNPNARSLNLATAAGIGLYEAVRQTSRGINA